VSGVHYRSCDGESIGELAGSSSGLAARQEGNV